MDNIVEIEQKYKIIYIRKIYIIRKLQLFKLLIIKYSLQTF